MTASPPTLSHYGAKCESPVGRGGDRGERTTSVRLRHFGGVVSTAHRGKDDILLFCRDADLVIVDSGYMVGWPALSSQVALLGLVHYVPLATICCASLLGADTCI